MVAQAAPEETDEGWKLTYGDRQAGRGWKPRIQMLIASAGRGDPKAQLLVAEAYLYGDRVPYNAQKAAEYFLKAAEFGLPEAQYNIGTMLLSGSGIPEDGPEGVRWIGLAAEQGLVEAQYALGRLILAGDAGLQRDPVAGSNWLQAAAQQGFEEAENHLGFALLEAAQLSQDDAEQERWAAHYLGIAAQRPERPDSQAQYELGRMYLQGRGVEKDAGTGAAWISAAANQGNADAQLLMAELLMKGEGVEANPEWAAFWLEKAQQNGGSAAPAAA